MEKVAIYWSFVLLTFIYIITKNYRSLTRSIIILSFYAGLAAFFGRVVENPYKIVLALLSIFLLFKNFDSFRKSGKEDLLLIAFTLFSFTFFYSSFANEDYFNLIFSQYGKYLTPVCLYFVLNIFTREHPELINYKRLLFSLLNIQIFLTLMKVLFVGIQESTVGSIAYIGGGQATTLPILGFMLLWIHKNGEIKRKDWIYTFLLLFIGFASLKRAIWFIMPFFVFLFLYYVPGKLKIKHLLYIFILIPFIFYFGVRFNPTLNKEGKIGGSFDLQYVLTYVQEYNFGKSSELSDTKSGEGRGGATLLILEKLFREESFSAQDYWGFGLQKMYTTDYETFDEKNFGINSKGAATGIFQTYITAGYFGIMTTLLFIISIIMLIKEPRIRITIGIFMFYDYLFYSGLILRTQALFILLFFIIIISNRQFEQRLFQKQIT